ncbi:hypothetical protein [Jannaschia sp. R86511]|uniref:hypothetical protein n=1 Tax=Jannaschia sp. R86511 TaxID=3093853 RepID=UPI0036D28EFA
MAATSALDTYDALLRQHRDTIEALASDPDQDVLRQLLDGSAVLVPVVLPDTVVAG